ncbi:MAG: FemAB family PEP-CTERM system-associated protein [Bdellovibrionales bacterium]|nr:FemAB family PEP-CTERM system-associated protein [Bdellovibrionales bacterium]
MTCSVRVASDADRQSWDDFHRSAATLHHAFDWGWRSIIRDTFGHKPLYFIATDDSGQVQAAAPVFHVKSFLFGSALISVPYLNAGGIISKTDDAAEAVERAIDEKAKELGVDYVELRCRKVEPLLEGRYSPRSHKVAMELQLTADPEEQFKTFPAKLRSQIRRPTKSGLYVKVAPADQNYSEDFKGFYSVFAENMRDLGTPVYPKSLFSRTLKHFGKRAQIITVWQEQRPLAAGITLQDRGHVEIPWASSLRKANKLSPNMLLYWESIKAACQAGADVFDFGRSSPDSGTFRFKKQWGAEPVELCWYYHQEMKKIPDINPNNPRFNAVVACWKRLPIPVANAIGPWITKAIP